MFNARSYSTFTNVAEVRGKENMEKKVFDLSHVFSVFVGILWLYFGMFCINRTDSQIYQCVTTCPNFYKCSVLIKWESWPDSQTEGIAATSSTDYSARGLADVKLQRAWWDLNFCTYTLHSMHISYNSWSGSFTTPFSKTSHN